MQHLLLLMCLGQMNHNSFTCAPSAVSKIAFAALAVDFIPTHQKEVDVAPSVTDKILVRMNHNSFTCHQLLVK